MAQALGSVIRAARNAAGLTQQQLAAKAGITERWIRAYEKGKTRNPSIERLKALSRALGIPLERLTEAKTSRTSERAA